MDHVRVHRLAPPGAAGLLDGPRRDHALAALGRPARARRHADQRRVVEHGKIVTAAGVSSGIDMALRSPHSIAGDEVAQAIQLGIEYDPQPPFDTGSVEKAPPEIVELIRRRLAYGAVLERRPTRPAGLADADGGPLYRAVRHAVHTGTRQCRRDSGRCYAWARATAGSAPSRAAPLDAERVLPRRRLELARERACRADAGPSSPAGPSGRAAPSSTRGSA